MNTTLLRHVLMASILLSGFAAAPALAENPDIARIVNVSPERFQALAGDGFMRHYIMPVQPEDTACTTRQLLDAAGNENAPQDLVQRTLLDTYEDLYAYVQGSEGQGMLINIYRCRPAAADSGSVSLVCADADTTQAVSSFVYCAPARVDSYVEAESAGNAMDTLEEDLPQDNLDSDQVGRFTPAEPVVGTSIYRVEDETITIKLVHADDTTHRFRLHRGASVTDREAACRTDKLFNILADTGAEVGDNYPSSTYDQLLEVLAGDDNGRGYVWYGECDRTGVSTSGLFCVAPWQDTPVEVRLEACAYTEGVVIDD